MTNNRNDRKISVSCPKCKRPITFNDPSPPGQLGPPGPPGPRALLCVVCPSCKTRLQYNPPLAPPDPFATPAAPATIQNEDTLLSSPVRPLPPEPYETISPTTTYRATHRLSATTPTDPDTLIPIWEMPGFIPLLGGLMIVALTLGFATRHAMGPTFATLFLVMGALTLGVASAMRWGWRNYWGISALGGIFYETLGAARLLFSDHPGEHKYGFLLTMMFFGGIAFFLRGEGLELNGSSSSGSSCGSSCGGGGCGGGGCGGGGCGG